MDFFQDLATSFYNTFIYQDNWQFFASGLATTLVLTLATFILGTLLGAAFCALRMTRFEWLNKTADAINRFFIQLPTVVLLMIFAYVIFVNVPLPLLFVVIIGLTLKAASYIADIFFAAVTAVSSGEGEAALTLGMTRFQAFRNVTLPQAVQSALPLYKNQFVITMQETSIVGYLALMDITRAASVVMSRTFDALFGLVMVAVFYIILGAIVAYLLGLLGRTKHLGDDTKAGA